MADHLEAIRRKLATLDIQDAPRPWHRKTIAAVGGLTDVGFGRDQELLLVVSSSGRAVFDCNTGERVARDRSEPSDDWYDPAHLEAYGIGPLGGVLVRLSGLNGGGLSCRGIKGWSVDSVVLRWPQQSLLFVEPFKWIFDTAAQITLLGLESETRAFGFSDTGRSLVLATSSEVTIWQYTE